MGNTVYINNGVDEVTRKYKMQLQSETLAMRKASRNKAREKCIKDPLCSLQDNDFVIRTEKFKYKNNGSNKFIQSEHKYLDYTGE